MDMSALITKMVIFVVLMVIGYVCTKIKSVSSNFAKDASRMVVNVFMTGTILNSVLAVETRLSGHEFAIVAAVICTAILVGWLLATISCRFMNLGENTPVFELLIGVVNNMFIAIPVVDTIFGSQAVFYCALSCIPFNIILYTYGIYRLKSGTSDKIRIKDIFSVPLIATLVGLMIFIFNPPIPTVFRETVSTIAAATVPMSMIVIGATLGNVSLADSFKNWKLYVMCLIRLIICPFIVWLLTGFLTTDVVLRVTATVIAACPSGVMVSVLALQYDRDAVFASEGVLLSTVLSMVTIPVIVYIVM
jgi:hypothetical protein